MGLLTNNESNKEKIIRETEIDYRDYTGVVSIKEVFNAAGFIYKLLDTEVIYKDDPSIEEDFAATIDSLVMRGYLELSSPNGNSTSSFEQCMVSIPQKSKNQVDFFCSLLWPFIECYWITCILLFQIQPDGIPFNSIIERCQWLANNLYKQGKCYCAETISKETIQNALHFFKLFNVIQIHSGKISISESYRHDVKKENFASLVISINRFRKNRTFATAQNGQESPGDITSIILSKFPILSKL